jgi:hypothetical protein
MAMASAAAAWGQQVAPVRQAATGTISGHVYCADTNAPARMATVMLEAVKEVDGNKPGVKDGARIHATSVQTLLDGSFTMPKVSPGSYYVIATLPGYLSPFAALGESAKDLRSPDAALKEKFSKLIPRVTVQANLPATIEVRLERGAGISGTVRYDDGSPASGLAVHPLVRKKDRWQPIEIEGFKYGASIVTDDQGNYRISGLAAEEYLVEIDLSLITTHYDMSGEGSSSSTDELYSLPIYSGGNFRTKDAKPFVLKLGEQRAGEDVEIPLNKLHRLSGNILAARDGHIVNGGEVALLNADDQTEVAKTKLTKDDTMFNFNFVPEGNYLLRSSGAKDVEYREEPNPPGSMPPTHTKETVLHTYGTVDVPLHIENDASGVMMSVPDPAAKSGGD